MYDPTTANAAGVSPVDKTKHIEEVEKDLLKMAQEAADVVSEVMPVDKKWHAAIAGRDGTTLNAYVYGTQSFLQ